MMGIVIVNQYIMLICLLMVLIYTVVGILSIHQLSKKRKQKLDQLDNVDERIADRLVEKAMKFEEPIMLNVNTDRLVEKVAEKVREELLLKKRGL